MSLITQQGEHEILETSAITKVSATTKKTLKIYFERPLFYTFHLGLFGMVFSLLLNRSLPWQFYLILAGLFTANYYGEAQRTIKRIYVKRTRGARHASSGH